MQDSVKSNRTLFELDLLRALVMVADCGSFTTAATRLHSTQSTVSQKVRRLEELAGHRLLERGHRDVHPTDAGHTLLGYARRMLDLNEEMAQALAGATVVLEGPRRGDIESLGAPRISGCVMHLRIQHGPVPGVALNGNDHEGLLRMEGCDGRRTVHVPVHLQASDHLRGGPSDLYENAAPSGQPLPALTSLSPFSLFIP